MTCTSCDLKDKLNAAFDEWFAAYYEGLADPVIDKGDLREAWFLGYSEAPPVRTVGEGLSAETNSARTFLAGVNAAIASIKALIPEKCSTPASLQCVSAWEVAIEKLEALRCTEGGLRSGTNAQTVMDMAADVINEGHATDTNSKETP